MRLILKFIFLLTLGLSIVIIFYPFLHEIGHSVIALFLGAKVMEFQIFPIPSVLLKMNTGISEIDFLIIGFSGVLLPYIISFLFSTKSFYKWYVRTVLQWICIVSFINGIISIIAYRKGSPVQNDDITIILQNSPQYIEFCFVILLLLLITAIIMFVKDFTVLNNKKIYRTF